MLTEPKSALVKQFRTQLAMSQAELHITGGALRSIASTAVHKGTGARGLRTILEDLLHQAQFEVRVHETDLGQAHWVECDCRRRRSRSGAEAGNSCS